MNRRELLGATPLLLAGRCGMTNTGELSISRSVVLNGSGNGAVALGPTFTGETWHVTNTAVSTSSAAAHPKAQVFLGVPIPGNLRDATYAGDNDSSDTVYDLRAGQILTVVWTGGDPGATATAVLSGQKASG